MSFHEDIKSMEILISLWAPAIVILSASVAKITFFIEGFTEEENFMCRASVVMIAAGFVSQFIV